MDKQARVTILIVNWNGKALLTECLDSVFSQTYDNFHVVLVDNGSVDGSVDLVSCNYPQVKIISLTENHGFAGGNNQGLPYCTGEFLALVNNDVVLSPDWLDKIILPMDADPAVGLCSSKIFIKGTLRLDAIGDQFTTAFTGSKLGENELGSDYDRDFHVDGACAAAALYRLSMIEKIGFFDEDLFLNYEDTDLNLRAKMQGWRCVYVPGACCQHAVNSTIGTMSSISVFYFSRNGILVLVKNIPWRLIFRCFPQRLYFELVALVYYGIWHRQMIAYLRGKWAALLMLPRMLKKRKGTIGSICLTDSEILESQYPITRHVFTQAKKLFRAFRVSKVFWG